MDLTEAKPGMLLLDAFTDQTCLALSNTPFQLSGGRAAAPLKVLTLHSPHHPSTEGNVQEWNGVNWPEVEDLPRGP